MVNEWTAPEQCRPNDAYVGIVRTSTGTHQRILRRTGMHTFGPWEYWGSLEEGGPKFATDDDVSELVEIDPFVARNLVNAEADRDRWRRAHEIVEAERDQARSERDEVQERADQLRDERDDAVQACITVGRDRDEWRARAEASEARTAPAVTRDEIEKVVRRYIPNPHFSDPIADEVCALFGVEAEPADPVEDKARELWDVARPSDDVMWRDLTSEAQQEYRRIAAHVLGQEAGQ